MGYYNGTMYIKGKLNSFDHTTNKDVFGIKGNPTRDHIWPIARNGSNSNHNAQHLSNMANMEKSYELKGVINGVRYVVHRVDVDERGSIIGQMFISKNGGQDWYEIIDAS